MDFSTSEYSSGCASGWTMYLDPFSSSNVQWNRSMEYDNDFQSKGPSYVHEDEEDLSMLSDASSGPPHFHQDEDSSEDTRYNSTMTISESKRSKNRMKVKESKRNQQNYHHLDDTASSHVLSFSEAPQRALFFENNAVHNNDKYFVTHDSGLSQGQGFSATNCKKGKSGLKKHFGFFKS